MLPGKNRQDLVLSGCIPYLQRVRLVYMSVTVFVTVRAILSGHQWLPAVKPEKTVLEIRAIARIDGGDTSPERPRRCR